MSKDPPRVELEERLSRLQQERAIIGNRLADLNELRQQVSVDERIHPSAELRTPLCRLDQEFKKQPIGD